MQQHTIMPSPGSTKTRKRVGRGGQYRCYSGRGMKGQNARSGGGVRPGFEGGQTPLFMRMPKIKGFRNINKVHYFPLNLSMLESFEDGATVNLETLLEKGILKKAQAIKLLGQGELSKKLHISVELASASAKAKVEKAGGSLTLLLNSDDESSND